MSRGAWSEKAENMSRKSSNVIPVPSLEKTAQIRWRKGFSCRNQPMSTFYLMRVLEMPRCYRDGRMSRAGPGRATRRDIPVLFLKHNIGGSGIIV